MSTPTATLLSRHQPLLKYDSQETFFADSATEWTDNPGNLLRTAAGHVIARAGHGLTLATLCGKYPDGTMPAKTDVISDPSGDDYRKQARLLHEQPAYANQLYGHAVRDSAGDLWLQYWFYYFYNDYNLIGDVIKAGLHECDWEMIQIRLRDEKPDRAVYAQHNGADARDWRQVDLLAGTQRPFVYVARGSHASYFTSGTQWTGYWFDYADGKRRSPELKLNVVVDGDPTWRWVRWPGSWGDTTKGDSPLDSDSPRGPGAHAQWVDPLALERKADSLTAIGVDTSTARPIPPPAPRVGAAWDGAQMRIDYTLPRVEAVTAARPGSLVVTINSPDESAPPTSETFRVEQPAGTVTIAAEVDRSNSYDIYVSAADADGTASESIRTNLGPARRV